MNNCRAVRWCTIRTVSYKMKEEDLRSLRYLSEAETNNMHVASNAVDCISINDDAAYCGT
jgi:hypothetical protein